MKAELISKTLPTGAYFGEVQNTEELLAAIARVSSGKPPEERTDKAAKLLIYCLKHGHWSVFEHAHFTLRLECSLYIAQQLLRHRSFTFQQFSMRYQTASAMVPDNVELRKAGSSNRQGSGDVITDAALLNNNSYFIAAAFRHYELLIEAGVSPETARQVLPQCTLTEVFMTGNVRSWIHYLQQRLDEHSQKEHRILAAHVCEVLRPELPIIFEHFNW